MADNARQEVEFAFNGSTYRVRPTFKIITDVESATGGQSAKMLGIKALLAAKPISERIAEGTFSSAPEISLGEVAVALYWVLRDAMKDNKAAPQNPAAVGEILMEDGYSDLLLPLGVLLTRAQKGNREHAKEAEAAETVRKAAAEAAKGSGAAEAQADPPAPPHQG